MTNWVQQAEAHERMAPYRQEAQSADVWYRRQFLKCPYRKPFPRPKADIQFYDGHAHVPTSDRMRTQLGHLA